jgi:hypothetical protein
VLSSAFYIFGFGRCREGEWGILTLSYERIIRVGAYG